ncbi:MAG: DUF4405 domain-containing protein [Sedimentisphaerales bacterium]|nr:DUF4405 domain-containing protein [Sedimentisphaerales bacterium]
MEAKGKRRFNWRSFVSVLTAFSFLGLTITGIILFIVPPGRIANWSGWTIYALTKEQWIALHDWFGIIFVITVVFHLLFNIKPFISYFKSKVTKSYSLRPEWLLAMVVCIVVGVGTIVNTAPFSTLMTWNESIKNSWENTSQQAPVPHAELFTLTELAQQVTDVDLETMQANLQAQGIEVNSSDITIGELAESFSKTPSEIYQIALGQGGTERSRLGQMTLKEYCEQMNINVDEAVRKLKTSGFTVKSNMTIREIADSGGVHPSAVRTMLNQTNP